MGGKPGSVLYCPPPPDPEEAEADTTETQAATASCSAGTTARSRHGLREKWQLELELTDKERHKTAEELMAAATTTVESATNRP